MTPLEKAEQLGVEAPAIPRLGVPGCHWWSEGLHGMSRAGTATVFPQAIALAATWDPPLLHRIAQAIADEARAKADPDNLARYRGLTLWCPTINMARDPRWGRTEETYGEDPILTSQLAVAYVKGLQGDDPKYLETAATPKHFAVHNQETGRASSCFDVSRRLMHEYYFPAFRACVEEGKAASIMAAFSGINKVPCTANHWLLTDVLRKEWGFDGAVVSDWGAVRRLMDAQHYVSTYEDAVVAALDAGLDVMCDPNPLVPQTLAALKSGKLSEATLDRALTADLTIRFRLGMFDPPARVPYSKINMSVVGSPAHLELARQAALEGMVLLKNAPAAPQYGYAPLLPLDARLTECIAVLGPYAHINQYGAYSGSPAGPAPNPIEALKASLPDDAQVLTARWGDTDAALKAAAQADVVLVFLGLNGHMEHEGIDRPNTELPREQQEFIEKVVKTNPSTIVVLEGGSPMTINWIQDNVPAILLEWYPGEQGNQALMDILFGRCSPSGRLPLTFYQSDAELPPLDDYDITKGRTYMYLRKPALYPFGFGLSYTEFAYSHLQASATQMPPDGKVTLQVDIRNTGAMDGDEVVQLYMVPPAWPVVAPLKRLLDFQRIHVPKGETRTVMLTARARDMGYWDEKTHHFVTPPGRYTLAVGASSADFRVHCEVAVK